MIKIGKMTVMQRRKELLKNRTARISVSNTYNNMH